MSLETHAENLKRQAVALSMFAVQEKNGDRLDNYNFLMSIVKEMRRVEEAMQCTHKLNQIALSNLLDEIGQPD